MSYKFPHAHLLDTEKLTRADIEAVLSLAGRFADSNRQPNRKSDKFPGRTLVNLFFENSTRTRTSFELAAKRLGMDLVNIPIAHSSAAKGETVLDTVLNLDAMQIDALVIRHGEDGILQTLSKHVKAHIINAGDGKHAHPTQALLDALTILRRKNKVDGLHIAICGDVARSRVARSNVDVLKKLGAHVRVIAPDYFVSPDYKEMGVEIFDNLEKGIKDADIVMMLRVQHERSGLGFDFASIAPKYVESFGLNHIKLRAAKSDVVVLHPGPINRGIELTDALADDPAYSAIHEQVEMGVAVRMAVIDLLLSESKI